jgi:hydrogenase maturation protease
MEPSAVATVDGSTGTSTWTLLVCGDRSRGDDGAAVIAVERLPRRLRSEVRIRSCGRLEPDELVSALLSGPCLLLDTVHGVAPGTIVEIPLTQLLAGTGLVPASSHAVPMPIVVGLAASLGAPLQCGAFLGIGGTTFNIGERVSPAVDAALDDYVAAIVAHLRARSGARIA